MEVLKSIDVGLFIYTHVPERDENVSPHLTPSMSVALLCSMHNAHRNKESCGSRLCNLYSIYCT